MLIKTTLSLCLTPVKTAIINNKQQMLVGMWEKKEHFYNVGGNVN
jgi:hypothetical protein